MTRTDSTQAGSAPSASLGTTATVGVLWSTAQKWVARVGGLVTIAVVARHLSPDDFGLMAVAMTVLPLIYLIADFGFSTYIVQADDAEPALLSTAFWYSFGAAAVLAAALACAGPLVGAVLRVDGVTPVLVGLSPAVLVAGLNSVPTAILRRRMAFREVAVQAFVGSALGQVAAVVIAIMGGGVWALVAQVGVAQVGTTALAWIAARWRPRLEFSRTHFGHLARFGTNIVGVEGVAMVRTWAETALIGAHLGIANLGAYNLAQRLIQVAQDMSSAAIAPVSTVVFAHVRSDPVRLRSGYVRALSMTYAAVIPIMVAVCVCAGDIIPLVFGGQWDRSVVPAQALAIASVLIAGAVLDHGLYYGLGRPGRWLAYALAVDGLTVLATALTVRLGLNAVPLGLVAVALLATAARWVLVARLLDAAVWTVAKPLVTVGLAGAAGGGAGLLVSRAVDSLPVLVSLALTGLAIAVCHLLVLRLVAPAVMREIAGFTLRAVRARSRGRQG